MVETASIDWFKAPVLLFSANSEQFYCSSQMYSTSVRRHKKIACHSFLVRSIYKSDEKKRYSNTLILSITSRGQFIIQCISDYKSLIRLSLWHYESILNKRTALYNNTFLFFLRPFVWLFRTNNSKLYQGKESFIMNRIFADCK